MTNKHIRLGGKNRKSLIVSIKNKKDFEELYKSGKVLFSEDKKIKVRYILSKYSNQTMVAIVVSSDSGSSVWRNRFKRLVRESIRLEKNELIRLTDPNNSKPSILISPHNVNQDNYRNLSLNEIQPPISDIINKIKKRISGE